MKEYLYLEHDGKLLLVDNDGNGPEKPVMGWIHEGESLIRLPTVKEVKNMNILWEKKRENLIYFANVEYKVIIGMPKIDWPENWAWKDSVISDNAVHPVVRESVYRTIHRVVSKIIIENQDSDFLYINGLSEPNLVSIIYKENNEPKESHEILIIKD